MLIVFPLGLLATAVLFDVIHLVSNDDRRFAILAYWMTVSGIVGGLVAFERARQLERAGERPALLALIDAGLTYSLAVLRTVLEADHKVITEPPALHNL